MSKFQIVRVYAPKVNDTEHELDVQAGISVLEALSSGRLEGDYFNGRQIINELITDDWGAPPIHLCIEVRHGINMKTLEVPYDDTPCEEIAARMRADLDALRT